MKVKVISRSTDEFTREISQDLQRVFRNYDPILRPQEKALEYQRALNAVKLDKNELGFRSGAHWTSNALQSHG
ncbi:hypothetical protein RYX36_015948 [Vicia faba]